MSTCTPCCPAGPLLSAGPNQASQTEAPTSVTILSGILTLTLTGSGRAPALCTAESVRLRSRLSLPDFLETEAGSPPQPLSPPRYIVISCPEGIALNRDPRPAWLGQGISTAGLPPPGAPPPQPSFISSAPLRGPFPAFPWGPQLLDSHLWARRVLPLSPSVLTANTGPFRERAELGECPATNVPVSWGPLLRSSVSSFLGDPSKGRHTSLRPLSRMTDDKGREARTNIFYFSMA